MSVPPSGNGFPPAIGYAGNVKDFKLLGAATALGIVGLVAVSACVSPPRPVGPTTLAGPLPGAVDGASATATRAPGATDGPLQILESRFTWTHVTSTEATFEWACTVDNPSQETFRVTIIVRLEDADGRPVKTVNQAFSINGKTMLPVEGEGLVDGSDVDRVAAWRLEYWPQLANRPIR